MARELTSLTFGLESEFPIAGVPPGPALRESFLRRLAPWGASTGRATLSDGVVLDFQGPGLLELRTPVEPSPFALAARVLEMRRAVAPALRELGLDIIAGAVHLVSGRLAGSGCHLHLGFLGSPPPEQTLSGPGPAVALAALRALFDPLLGIGSPLGFWLVRTPLPAQQGAGLSLVQTGRGRSVGDTVTLHVNHFEAGHALSPDAIALAAGVAALQAHLALHRPLPCLKFLAASGIQLQPPGGWQDLRHALAATYPDPAAQVVCGGRRLGLIDAARLLADLIAELVPEREDIEWLARLSSMVEALADELAAGALEPQLKWRLVFQPAARILGLDVPDAWRRRSETDVARATSSVELLRAHVAFHDWTDPAGLAQRVGYRPSVNEAVLSHIGQLPCTRDAVRIRLWRALEKLASQSHGRIAPITAGWGFGGVGVRIGREAGTLALPPDPLCPTGEPGPADLHLIAQIALCCARCGLPDPTGDLVAGYRGDER